MAVTIADLEINIQSTGNEMIATFTKLATKLNALSGHLDKATSSMKKVSKAMGDTGKEAKKAGEGAEKGAKGLGNFANSILRIMKYRAIRAVLKTITQGFREGVQNLALYSAAINETDVNKANQVMSAYASMGAQIKNSLGAAVMPLLANLLPVIQKVADMFMDAAEAVAKFFATLNGQTTYTAANRDYWVDYAKNLNKATGAAKELKRTILGFDEINALNSQSKGGSGSSTPNYKDMFVEKTNDWFGLKDTFEGVLDTVKAIGIALAAWKIATGVSNLLSKLIGFNVEKFNKILAGGIALSLGVYLSWEGGKTLATGDLKAGLIESITGALSAALGGAIIGFQTCGGKGALIGATIGLGISLVTTAISFGISSQSEARSEEARQFLSKELAKRGYTLDDISEGKISASAELVVNLRTQYNQIKENYQEIFDQIEMAKGLIEEIFQFQSKDNLTLEEINKINIACETLNSLGLGNVRVEWNKLTGVVSTNREEIENALAAYKRFIEAKAYQEIAIEAKKGLYYAQKELETISGEYDAVHETFKKIARENYGVVPDWLADEHQRLLHQKLDLEKLIQGYQDDLDKALNYTSDNIESAAKDAGDTVSKAVGDVVDDIKEGTDEARRKIENTFKPSNIIKPGAWADALKSAVSNLPSINFSVSGSNLIPRVQTKASGGFVPSGDLFVAGEAGAELIMAAPNGSEVVNMAQFESAMMNAVSMAGGNGGDWTIVVQDSNGTERSRQVITAAERANRRDGRTIIPVGVY